MATITAIIFVTLCNLCRFNMYSSSSIPAHDQYPTGSLACKDYDMTKMDCTYRNLVHVPEFESNLTGLLDLSHNQLNNISGAPFAKQHSLLELILQWNGLYDVSSTAFRGLYSLLKLDLRENQ